MRATISIKPELKERLRRFAFENKVSQSKVIADLIEKYIPEKQNKKNISEKVKNQIPVLGSSDSMAGTMVVDERIGVEYNAVPKVTQQSVNKKGYEVIRINPNAAFNRRELKKLKFKGPKNLASSIDEISYRGEDELVPLNENKGKVYKKPTLEESRKYMFSGPKDLSSRIDEILYGK